MVDKRPGRPPTAVRGDFFVTPPNEVQAAIVVKKNNGGNISSWQDIADEINDKEGTNYSDAYIYKVAKGEIKPSAAVRRALGMEKPYPPYKKILPTDPAQVRRQIAKYMPGYELVRKVK